MKNTLVQRIDKLARHIERTTLFEIERFEKATLGNYNEDDSLLHEIENGFRVTGDNGELIVFAFDNNTWICKAIPHEGYDVLDIVWGDGYTQSEVFTMVAMRLDRILNR